MAGRVGMHLVLLVAVLVTGLGQAGTEPGRLVVCLLRVLDVKVAGDLLGAPSG